MVSALLPWAHCIVIKLLLLLLSWFNHKASGGLWQQSFLSLATSQPRWKTSPSLGEEQRSPQATCLPVTPLLQTCMSPSLDWVGHPLQTAWIESLRRVVVWVFVFWVFFFFFLPCHSAYGILVPWPGSKLVPSALEAHSLNHSIPREIPRRVIV